MIRKLLAAAFLAACFTVSGAHATCTPLDNASLGHGIADRASSVQSANINTLVASGAASYQALYTAVASLEDYVQVNACVGRANPPHGVCSVGPGFGQYQFVNSGLIATVPVGDGLYGASAAIIAGDGDPSSLWARIDSVRSKIYNCH